MRLSAARHWKPWRAGALALVMTASAPTAPPVARHDVHVTLTRMAVDSGAIVSRVRCFKDDLQLGLMKFYRMQKLDLGTSKDADSLFAGYLAERMWVEVDGVRLKGVVQSSGVEVDEQGQPMMWFVVEYTAVAPPRTLGVRNDLLFEMFPSQQNIVNVLSVRDDRRFSFYFVPGNAGVQQVSLR